MFSRVSPVRFSLVLFLSFVVLFTACGQNSSTTTGSQPAPTPTVARDVYGTPIVFPASAPQRIVSLTPSMSEILGALQLQGRVVAVDYYTTYPAEMASLPKISDANGKYNLEQIVALKPDLVLSDGGLTQTYDSQFKNLGLHVVDLPSATLSQILQQIVLVGQLTFTGDTAKTLVNQLLQDANGINIFHANTSNGGYPQVTDEAIIAANPQFVILTEDPVYGGNPALVYKRPNWSSIEALQVRQVYHLNVNIIQHPSQRLVDGLRCLAQLIHPARFSGALPAYCSGTA